MDRAEHYRRAEQLAEQAADRIREGAEAGADRLIALAQVHATLAASADSATLAAVVGAAAAATAAVATVPKARGNFTVPTPATRNERGRVTDHVEVRDYEIRREMSRLFGGKQP